MKPLNDKMIDHLEADQSTPDAEIIDKMLDDAPPKQKEVIKELMISMQQMRMESNPASEVMKKLTKEHITNFLDASRDNMEKGYRDKNFHRLFLVVMALLMMSFIVIIVVLLKDNQPDMLEKVLYTGGGLVVGLLGGYGFGKSQRDE